MATIIERASKTARNIRDYAASKASALAASGREALESHAGIEEKPKDFDQFMETVQTHVRAGHYQEAANEVGHQTYLNARLIGREVMEKLTPIAEFLEEIVANPQEKVAEIFDNFGKKLINQENPMLKKVGHFFRVMAEFVRNPQEKLGAVWEENSSIN